MGVGNVVWTCNNNKKKKMQKQRKKMMERQQQQAVSCVCVVVLCGPYWLLLLLDIFIPKDFYFFFFLLFSSFSLFFFSLHLPNHSKHPYAIKTGCAFQDTHLTNTQKPSRERLILLLSFYSSIKHWSLKPITYRSQIHLPPPRKIAQKQQQYN